MQHGGIASFRWQQEVHLVVVVIVIVVVAVIRRYMLVVQTVQVMVVTLKVCSNTIAILALK